MKMKQLLLAAAFIGGAMQLTAQDLAPGINYSYNPPGANGIITDITVDVVNNDASSAGSFDVAMYLYDQATTNVYIIGTTNIPSLSGYSVITISNWDIDINDTPGIPAGTYRLGIWVDSNEDISEADENDNAGLLAGNINYNPSASGIETSALEAASVNCFPNPVNDFISISYTLTDPSEVTVNVFDALGNLVETSVSSGTMQAGSHTTKINTSNYASGMYFVHVTCGDATVTRKMTVVHE